MKRKSAIHVKGQKGAYDPNGIGLKGNTSDLDTILFEEVILQLWCFLAFFGFFFVHFHHFNQVL